MVGPNKQFDETTALSKALNVFWAKGFEATSMQELVAAMEINRASMYQTFGNKKALFNASVDQYIDNSLNYLSEVLSAQESPLTNLKTMFELLVLKISAENIRGCFIANTAAELGPHDAEIADKVRFFWQQLERHIGDTLRCAIDKGEIINDNPRQLAHLLNSTLLGLVTKTKANVELNSLKEDIDFLFKMIVK